MGVLGASVVMSVAALAFLECLSFTRADIQCYRCILASPVVNYYDSSVKLCKDFDYSEKFIVNCPYSTFCVKSILTAKIPYPINGIERDCANQKQKRYTYKNKTWIAEFYVDEVYEEGCQVINDKGARTSRSEYCYCKGSLCNSAGVSAVNIFLYILSAVIVLLSTWGGVV